MESLELLVRQTIDGDADAFAAIVARFQDMAVGYAYAMLGDAGLAEDAAQEAFLDAYRNLSQLREPAAFPGWFRRVVHKHCDRLTRRRQLETTALDDVAEIGAVGPHPLDDVERGDSAARLRLVVERLPEHERGAVTLFYLGGRSHAEIARFLDVPVSTVKKRLHDGRARLRKLMLEDFEAEMQRRRPSRDDAFARNLLALLEAARAGNVAPVGALLRLDARLATARDWLGNSALVLAANAGREEVTRLLAQAGVQADYFESAAIGATARVRDFLRSDPLLLNAFSNEGLPAVSLAAHFGHVETIGFLAASGADVDAVARNRLQVAPLHAALFGRRPSAALALLEAGADANARRGGEGLPRSGWTPMHYVAGLGFDALVTPLLDRKARINTRDDAGRTPLAVAIEEGRATTAGLLRSRGALA